MKKKRAHRNYLDVLKEVMKKKRDVVISTGMLFLVGFSMAGCSGSRESVQRAGAFPASYRGASPVVSVAPPDTVIAKLPYKIFFADQPLQALIDTAVENLSLIHISEPTRPY